MLLLDSLLGVDVVHDYGCGVCCYCCCDVDVLVHAPLSLLLILAELPNSLAIAVISDT